VDRLTYIWVNCSATSDSDSSVDGFSPAFIDYGSTPGGQGDGSFDREKAEGEVTLTDLSVSAFLDEVSPRIPFTNRVTLAPALVLFGDVVSMAYSVTKRQLYIRWCESATLAIRRALGLTT